MGFLDEIAKHHNEWIDVVKLFGIKNNPEDIVQDMYLKLAESDINLDKNWRGYVYISLRNLSYTQHKKTRHDLEVKEELTQDNTFADNRLNYLDLQKCLHELPILERQVLQLHKIEGISLNEIERETGVCKMKMSRIKKKATIKLKALLNQ